MLGKSVRKEKNVIKEIPMPVQFVNRVWKRIPVSTKITFFTTFTVGVLAHVFMITNKLPAHDDIWMLFSPLRFEAYGRWFAFFPTLISSSFSMPGVNALLALVYLSAAACVVTALLRIGEPLLCVLVGLVMVVFPSVAASMICMAGVDGNFFAMMLSCLAVYLASKYRFGFAAAFVLITLAMGVYQIYFAMAAGLFVLVLLIAVVDLQPVKTALLNGAKYVGVLIASMGAYFVMVRLTATELVPYQGLDSMGKINIAEIPSMVIASYTEAARFFLRNSLKVHYRYMGVFWGIAFLAVAGLIVWIIIHRKIHTSAARTVLLGVLVLILPLAANIVFLMGSGKVHMLMMYGLVLIPIGMLALLSVASQIRAEGLPTETPQGFRMVGLWAVPVLSWAIIGVLLVSSFGYGIKSNQAYFRQYLAYEQAFSFSSQLLSRIANTQGFTPDDEILLVGVQQELTVRNAFIEIEPFALFTDPKVRGESPEFMLYGAYPPFLKYYMGVNQTVVRWIGGDPPAGLTTEQIKQIEEMPIYPEEGSIHRVGESIVVKFS
ncbi:MAG: glucosyltransferase domain-containing protein, partial [Propionibacteriaceae bacterium]|nr:glucosyltransferase domain-containing protein [Propionibacteriaceae bacterium]